MPPTHFKTLMNLPPIYSGKRSILKPSPDEYQIVNVPVVDPSKNQMIDTSFISINQRQLVGTSKTSLSGYYKNSIASYYFGGHGDARLKKFLEKH